MKTSTVFKLIAIPVCIVYWPFLVYLGSAALADEIIKEKGKRNDNSNDK